MGLPVGGFSASSEDIVDALREGGHFRVRWRGRMRFLRHMAAVHTVSIRAYVILDSAERTSLRVAIAGAGF